MDELDLNSQIHSQMAMLGVSDFSWWALWWALVFGIVGARFFMRGRKKKKPEVLWLGVGLMVYPMFSMNVWFVFIGGIVMTGLAIYCELE
jgi:hypothetical protein